jgi:hypothetical protein
VAFVGEEESPPLAVEMSSSGYQCLVVNIDLHGR